MTVTIAPLPPAQAQTCYEVARRLGHRWAVAIADGEIPAAHESLSALREAVQALPGDGGIDGPGLDGERNATHQSGHGSIVWTVFPDGGVRALVSGYDPADGTETRHPALNMTRYAGGVWQILCHGHCPAAAFPSAISAAAHLTGWPGERIARYIGGPWWAAWVAHEVDRWAAEARQLVSPTQRWGGEEARIAAERDPLTHPGESDRYRTPKGEFRRVWFATDADGLVIVDDGHDTMVWRGDRAGFAALAKGWTFLPAPVPS